MTASVMGSTRVGRQKAVIPSLECFPDKLLVQKYQIKAAMEHFETG